MKIHLAKERFKFSASHFTIFGPNEAEALHGHNYYLSINIELKNSKLENGISIDFNVIKPILIDLCHDLDEKILLAKNSEFLKIAEMTHENRYTQIECFVNSKFYSFPKEYVKLLSLENITCETLAQHMLNQFAQKIKSDSLENYKKMKTIEICVEETRGQAASASIEI